MSLTNPDYVVGDVANKFQATIQDEDGSAIDLSAASELKLYLRGPNGFQSLTASKTNDGSDGQIEYALLSTTLDLPGVWERQWGFTTASLGPVRTEVIQFRVHQALA